MLCGNSHDGRVDSTHSRCILGSGSNDWIKRSFRSVVLHVTDEGAAGVMTGRSGLCRPARGLRGMEAGAHLCAPTNGS